ncbi:MAG: CapA family protein [Butyrivibrio sp.]|nr:CapA family protein [Butyrivibrio sp.]
MEILLDKILGKRNIAVLSALLTMGLLGGCGSEAAGAVEVSEVQALEEAGAEAFSANDNLGVEVVAGSDEIIGDESANQNGAANSVHIVMVGDILLHTPVEEAAKDDETGKYDFSFIFENTEDIIKSADIAIANQEVIIGGEELGVSGYPAFNAPYEIGDALSAAGFDVICHATNHALDKGKKGITNCLAYWRAAHPDMLVTGIYDNEKDAAVEAIPIIERGGIKIAVLNYTYGTNGIAAPADMPYAVSELNKDRVVAQLDLAEKEADFTIVCPHWGTEYNLGISGEQKKWAQLFRDHGADLVIGTHPHVIEPVEFYEDEDKENITNNHGGGDMPVYYSLGNFVNWTSGTGAGTADRMVGGIAEITVSRKGNGEVSVDDFDVKNIVCHVSYGDKNIRVYPLDEYTSDLASENEIIKQDSSFSKEYCEKLCKEVYGD